MLQYEECARARAVEAALRNSQFKNRTDPAMGCEMATALPGATADGSTLFAHVGRRPADEGVALLWAAGRDYTAGESVQVRRITLPQVRRTNALIGVRTAGAWGCLHGVNEHGVAMGATPTHMRLRGEAPGLTGPDLVRLTLERASGAAQAVQTAADLISRHGQGPYAGCPPEDDHDNAFLIADRQEAYLLAACGGHWAVQQATSVRALNESCHLRQDWDRISPGLSSLAIERGWWPGDGSKLDFAGALARPDEADRRAYRWWGRATLLLEQQHGAVDHALMRRLLGETAPDEAAVPLTTTGLIAHLAPAESVPIAWCSFGPTGDALYFPLPVVAEPPPAFRTTGPEADGCPLWRRLTHERKDRPLTAEMRAALADLQGRFDQTASEFSAEALVLRKRGDEESLRRLAESFMQHNWERFKEAWEGVLAKEAAWETTCRMDAV